MLQIIPTNWNLEPFQTSHMQTVQKSNAEANQNKKKSTNSSLNIYWMEKNGKTLIFVAISVSQQDFQGWEMFYA